MLHSSTTKILNFFKIFSNKTVLIVGFALYSMFFGAGNLIFPISIGVETQDKFFAGGLGLLCTGIIVPLVGLLSVLYSKNDDLIEYFTPLGKIFSYLITFCILGLLGPLSVIPRSIMVASGAGQMILPFLPIDIVKLVICILLALITIFRNNIIELLGKYLTPLLLSGIVLIILLGITQGISIEASKLSNIEAFYLGFTEGYQTMDLLASLIFALMVIKYLKNKIKIEKLNFSFIYLCSSACLVCAFLLFITYSGFILLGAEFYNELILIDPSQRLLLLATNVLGSYSIPVVSFIIFLACLTTMCALTEIFAEFSARFINLKKPTLILITIAISYFISLVEFKTLASSMAYLLKTLYPALILFTVLRLNKNLNHKIIYVSFWIVFIISFAY